MSTDQYIDGLLIDWDASFFNQRSIAPTKPKRGVTGLPLADAVKSTPKMSGAEGARRRLAGIARRSPEVVVKISGGGRNAKQINDHLDYISRNGKLDVEDHDGEILAAPDEVRALKDEWALGGYPVGDAGKREAFNIVLSMPAGTDPQAVIGAARDFAAAEFSGHQYAMVLHTFDTDPDPTPSRHPHVHLCVKATALSSGARMNPRKADLQRWRELFAEALQERGVEAAATKRPQRLQRDGADSQGVYHRKQRGEAPTRSDVTRGPRVVTDSMARKRQTVLDAYDEIQSILKRSHAADQRLADDVATAREDGFKAKPVSRSKRGLQRQDPEPER